MVIFKRISCYVDQLLLPAVVISEPMFLPGELSPDLSTWPNPIPTSRFNSSFTLLGPYEPTMTSYSLECLSFYQLTQVTLLIVMCFLYLLFYFSCAHLFAAQLPSELE